MLRTWIITLGIFLRECDGKLITDDKQVIATQQENGRYLMNDMENLSESEKDKFQQCGKYLQTQMLSDVCNAKEDSINYKFYNGEKA